MKIEIHHRDIATGTFTHVATGNPLLTESVDAALEWAYRWTQNIDGSWSRDDLANNPDRNPRIEVLAPLPVYNGKIYGLRSSMMGDRFWVDGKPYVVAAFGFEEVPA